MMSRLAELNPKATGVIEKGTTKWRCVLWHNALAMQLLLYVWRRPGRPRCGWPVSLG
jgi:hypothetical protein